MVRDSVNGDTPEAGLGGEVAAYEGADGKARVDVRVDWETVWLTQRQMAQVFDTTPENVLMHLRNVFASGELEPDATTKEFLVVRTEGRRRVRRSLKRGVSNARTEKVAGLSYICQRDRRRSSAWELRLGRGMGSN